MISRKMKMYGSISATPTKVRFYLIHTDMQIIMWSSVYTYIYSSYIDLLKSSCGYRSSAIFLRAWLEILSGNRTSNSTMMSPLLVGCFKCGSPSPWMRMTEFGLITSVIGRSNSRPARAVIFSVYPVSACRSRNKTCKDLKIKWLKPIIALLSL